MPLSLRGKVCQMFKQTICIMRRECSFMWRDKGLRRILIFAPFIGLVLFWGIYSAQTLQDIPTAIVDLDHSSSSRALCDRLENAENLDVVTYPGTDDSLKDLIRQGDVVVGVVIPENFARDVTANKETRVLMLLDGSNMIYATNASTAVLGVTKTISAEAGIKTLMAHGMGIKEATGAYQSIQFREEGWFNPTLNYKYFLLLGLIMNIWQQCCMLVSCMNVIGETGQRSWIQVKAAGISKLKFFCSKSLMHILIFMLLTLPLYFISFVLLKLPLSCSFTMLMLFTLVFAISLHSIGTFMSSVACNAVDSSRLGMIIALPSFVLSGFTWPIEAMPHFLQPMVKIIPQTWFFQGLNYISFKSPDWDFMSGYFLAMVIIAVVCYSMSIIFTAWIER